VVYHDAIADTSDHELQHADARPVDLAPATVKACDCAVVVTGHDGVDYAALLENIPVLVDTRNVYAGVQSAKIVRL
jgi:UDP-N-acetyl-D-mannosaminuronate dehydrogenase